MTSWFNNLSGGLKGLAGDTLGAALGISIRDFIAGIGKKGHEVAVKKFEEFIKDNPRADLLYVLFVMDPADASTLWQRHSAAIATGTENTFVRTLGQALPRDAQGKVDLERAKAIFTQISQMDEARFCQILEELNHDPIAQHVRHWLKHGRGFAEALLEGIAYGAGAVARECGELNQRATQLADRINQDTQNRRTATRFGRLISRIP